MNHRVMNFSTLRRRLKGRKSRAEVRANSDILSILEEEVLVKRLLDIDKRGFSMETGLHSMVDHRLCYASVHTILVDS